MGIQERNMEIFIKIFLNFAIIHNSTESRLLVSRRELYDPGVVWISRHREDVDIRAGVSAAGVVPVAVSVSEAGSLTTGHSWYHEIIL